MDLLNSLADLGSFAKIFWLDQIYFLLGGDQDRKKLTGLIKNCYLEIFMAQGEILKYKFQNTK